MKRYYVLPQWKTFALHQESPSMPNVWRLVAHHEKPDQVIDWSKVNQQIAVGWGLIGDLRKQGYRSAADISTVIRHHYPGLPNASLGGPSLWNFYNEVHKGDLVIMSNGKRRIFVVEVLDDYEWILSAPAFMGGYQHQRRVQTTTWNADALWRQAGASPAPGQNRRWTMIRCRDPL